MKEACTANWGSESAWSGAVFICNEAFYQCFNENVSIWQRRFCMPLPTMLKGNDKGFRNSHPPSSHLLRRLFASTNASRTYVGISNLRRLLLTRSHYTLKTRSQESGALFANASSWGYEISDMRGIGELSPPCVMVREREERERGWSGKESRLWQVV